MPISEVIHQLGIDSALFDADDTLFHTHGMFVAAIAGVRKMLSEKYGISVEEIGRVWDEIAAKGYKRFSIDPVPSWTFLFHELFTHFNFDPTDKEFCMESMLCVYTQAPEVIEGSEETLMTLRSAGVRTGLVTHSPIPWTLIKLRHSGLGGYFEHVEHVPVNTVKGVGAWRNALQHMELNPERTLAAGDNLTGDVIASRDAGIALQIWINHPDSWGIYKQGKLFAGALEIVSIADLLPALEKHLETKLALR